MSETQGPDNSGRITDDLWAKIQAAVERTDMKTEQDFLLNKKKFQQLWELNEQVIEFSQTPEMMALEEANTPEADVQWSVKMDEFSRELALEHGLGEDEVITFQQYLGETFMNEFNNPSPDPRLN